MYLAIFFFPFRIARGMEDGAPRIVRRTVSSLERFRFTCMAGYLFQEYLFLIALELASQHHTTYGSGIFFVNRGVPFGLSTVLRADSLDLFPFGNNIDSLEFNCMFIFIYSYPCDLESSFSHI